MNDLAPITTAEIDRLFAVMPGDAATNTLSCIKAGKLVSGREAGL